MNWSVWTPEVSILTSESFKKGRRRLFLLIVVLWLDTVLEKWTSETGTLNSWEWIHSSDGIPAGVLHVKISVYFQTYFEKHHHRAKSWQMKLCFEDIHYRQSQSIHLSHQYTRITVKMKYSILSNNHTGLFCVLDQIIPQLVFSTKLTDCFGLL